MKLGDTFDIGYIYDKHPHNYDTGIITWIHNFKYYTHGDIKEYIVKKQIRIKFNDNTEIITTV